MGFVTFYRHLARFQFETRRKLDQEPRPLRSSATAAQMKTAKHLFFLRNIIFFSLLLENYKPTAY
jgi:hypothetical protein